MILTQDRLKETLPLLPEVAFGMLWGSPPAPDGSIANDVIGNALEESLTISETT